MNTEQLEYEYVLSSSGRVMNTVKMSADEATAVQRNMKDTGVELRLKSTTNGAQGAETVSKTAKKSTKKATKKSPEVAASEPATKPVATKPTETGVVVVDAARLAEDGDIGRSYSADKIPEKGNAVRKPFKHEDSLYVNVGGTSKRIKAYRIVPESEFEGTAVNVDQSQGTSYHGIRVFYLKKAHVLVGPPVTFTSQ